MSNYETVLSDASQLPVDDRLRLIDELASSVPDDRPLGGKSRDNVYRNRPFDHFTPVCVSPRGEPLLRVDGFAVFGVGEVQGAAANSINVVETFTA